jgi:thiol:disulfide interchange protein DsbD
MKRLLQWLSGAAITLCCAANVIAAQPLPAAQAFQVTAVTAAGNQIITNWKVAPDYFLYADKMEFTLTPDVSLNVKLPPTLTKEDALRGTVQVYGGEFIIPLQIRSNLSAFRLNISYQGCSKQGFCYPPMQKSFELHAFASDPNAVSNNIVTNQGISALLTDQYGVQTLLAYENRGWLLLIFLGIGFLLAFTPCVLPMLPILTGIIAGQKQSSSPRKAFILSASYVTGMAVTYALAGMLAAFAGGSLQVWLQTPVVTIISSLIFVFLAFSLFEFFDLPISRHWQNAVSKWSRGHEGGTIVGVFFMGILSTLVVSPCVTAPLVGVLLYISRTGDILLGGSALFVMGLGMGIPLMLLGVSAGKWLPKSGQWMQAVTKSFGVIMLGMAIWLLGRILPTTALASLWGLYLIAIACFFSLYLTKVIGRHKINHTLGFAAGITGLFMILSTVGMPIVLNRWTGEVVASNLQRKSDFVVVHTQAELADKLAVAKAANQPVLVDFYADWCTSCVVMEKEVFAQQKIQSALQPFLLLRVDLSQNTAEDQALLQHYDVIAPPSVLFFSTSGEEVNSRRIVGEMSAKDFLNRINVFMASSCDTKAQC